MNIKTIQIFILAGGKSSRMGSEKGLMLLSGKPFIEHIIATASKINNSVSILSNSNLYNHFGLPVHTDIIKEKGPLGGIYTGLTQSEHEHNLFVSCDIPLIRFEILNYLIQQITPKNDSFVIKHHSKTEPLCGIYSKKSIPLIKELLDKNELSVHRALEVLNTQLIDVTEHPAYSKNILYNINSKEELKNLEEELLCAK